MKIKVISGLAALTLAWSLQVGAQAAQTSNRESEQPVQRLLIGGTVNTRRATAWACGSNGRPMFSSVNLVTERSHAVVQLPAYALQPSTVTAVGAAAPGDCVNCGQASASFSA